MGEGERQCWARRGGAGGRGGTEGGSARPLAEVPCGFSCYSCSLTCSRKHRGKAPASPPQPRPSSSYPCLGNMDPSGHALSPGPVSIDPVGSPGEPLPVNASPDFDQTLSSALPFPLRVILYLGSGRKSPTSLFHLSVPTQRRSSFGRSCAG